MSIPGQPLSIAELVDYIETHARGTIDDEVAEALKHLHAENVRLARANEPHKPTPPILRGELQ
jgi:hypothetical protein